MAYNTVTQHSKVYPYTSIMAAPYSCDPTGVLDCAAAIEQIKANQSNVGRIFIPVGTFLINTNLTIPIGMTLDFAAGGKLSVASGKTLTVLGTIVDDGQQIFTGSGSIVISNLSTIKSHWYSTLALADAAATASGIILEVEIGTWSVNADTTLSASLKINKGAIFAVATGKTLTINGTFDAGLYRVFSLTGTGGVVFGTGAVKEVYPQWFYTSGSWASAFQAAINSITTGNIRVISGTYALGSTALTWKEKVNLIGDGIGRTNITSTATGFAIVWTCADGTTEREGPRFTDFTLTANSGIKLNDPANGFTDDATTQEYILRPTIERIKFIAATPNSGIGFQGSKCFSLKIAGCEFFRFNKNIDWHGCDDPVLQHSRIIGGNNGVCTNAEDGTYTYGTFGNRQLIGDSCQFNVLNAGASNNFIVSGAQELTIRDCYFEQGDVINAVVNVLDGAYTFRFLDNHFGVASNKTTYSIDFSSMVDIPQNVLVMGNFGYANLMDIVGFPAAGVKYHYNTILARNIYHAGNDSQLDISSAWPFNSNWSSIYSGSEAVVFSPNNLGLRSLGYYDTVRCFSGRFRLPALTSSDFLAFSLASIGRTIDGTVTVRVIARTHTAGQKYKINYLNGAAVIDTQEKTLTNADQEYCLTIWTGIVVADMSVRIWNEDTVHGGYVDVERIIITYD